MDYGSDSESISLWGVLHGGALTRISSDQSLQVAEFDFVVAHLNGFYEWPENAPIRFEIQGVTELRVNQWIPEPGQGHEDIGSRRWSRREWQSLERSIPPNSVQISESAVSRTKTRTRMEIAGLEANVNGSTNVLLEIVLNGTSLSVATPDGPVDLERLVQIGDAYWDNLGKKRKK